MGRSSEAPHRATRPLAAAGTLLLLAARAASAGGLYVASQNSESVLEYDAASGAFKRVVAETIAQGFQNPGGIALRPSDGVLHVTSQASGEIWRYTTATGALITPALKTGLYGPTGLAFDAAGANLYFADPLDALAETTDSLKKLTLPGGALSVIGTAVGAEFYGVALNGTQVFATDTDGNRVVRFPIGGGAATTVIGTGLSMPKGILFRVVDADADRGLRLGSRARVRAERRDLGLLARGAAGVVGSPRALRARARAGRASHRDGLQLQRRRAGGSHDARGDAPRRAGRRRARRAEGRGLERQHAARRQRERERRDLLRLRRKPDRRARARRLDDPRRRHRLLARRPAAADRQLASSNDVVEHDAVTGVLLRSFGAVCGFLPVDVAYGPDGRIYVACSGDNGVSRIDPATGQSLGPSCSAARAASSHRAASPSDPTGTSTCRAPPATSSKYDGATGSFLGVFVDQTGNGGGPVDPYGLAFHQGKLYVASFFPSEVKAFDATTGAFVSTFVASGAGGLSGPTALDFGPERRSLRDQLRQRLDPSLRGRHRRLRLGIRRLGQRRPRRSLRPGLPPERGAQVPALSPAACGALALCLAAAARALPRRGRRGAR